MSTCTVQSGTLSLIPVYFTTCFTRGCHCRQVLTHTTQWVCIYMPATAIRLLCWQSLPGLHITKDFQYCVLGAFMCISRPTYIMVMRTTCTLLSLHCITQSYLPDTVQGGQGKKDSNSRRECRIYNILSKLICAFWEKALRIEQRKVQICPPLL